MSYELLILGCGSATPTSKRNPTAQLLKMRERFFLIDCGEGTQQQLRRFKVKFSRINHIFISHLHGDHYFGLPGLLSSFHLLNRTNDLHLYGPPALEEVLNAVFKASSTTLVCKLIFHPVKISFVAACGVLCFFKNFERGERETSSNQKLPNTRLKFVISKILKMGKIGLVLLVT